MEVLITKSIWILCLLAGAPLLVSLFVGLLVSVFQAATQIQEQTLSFVPKLLAIFALWFFFGEQLIAPLFLFTKEAFLFSATQVW